MMMDLPRCIQHVHSFSIFGIYSSHFFLKICDFILFLYFCYAFLHLKYLFSEDSNILVFMVFH